MDGREAMAFYGGSASYYMHRGNVSGSGSGTQAQGFQQTPPGFRPLSNAGFQAQSNVRGVSVGSTFPVEPPRSNFSPGINISSSPGVHSGEPLKKKRGRPRKYGPDGPVSLGLSPMSATANSAPGSGTPSQKRNRGRPPGTGRKQQLAALGEWMNSSAGLAFAPHVITIGAGEDIVAKLLSLSQQRPRALCIMSGTGTVSSVTLRQPASANISLTYEGRFQILCLSGSYLVSEDGGPCDRTGGLSVSLSSPEGHVIGGGVAVLIAASPVQVVVCSFVYGSAKMKTKQVTSPKGEKNSEPQTQNPPQAQAQPLRDGSNKFSSPITPASAQNYTLSASSAMWPGDLKSSHTHTRTGIDLTRG
ncbi:AT-hook motif nuclear-localized protein 5-like [Prosopis cineraria]|uniref:AT-hook motif nuclear-localized protein 5-like n=1 Tax=Prosopis cineraria TaxID=364024 RepID=UPI002410355E|nr:AT-hook motif nuclear-localized protein 5-like [Prosopis cineraria]